jgi:hypothetical protein
MSIRNLNKLAAYEFGQKQQQLIQKLWLIFSQILKHFQLFSLKKFIMCAVPVLSPLQFL